MYAQEGPILIALCGVPGSGKTTVQEILERRLNVTAIDDGLIAREIPPLVFGYPASLCHSQEGKSQYLKDWSMTVRQTMGRFVAAMEREFDPMIMPRIAIQKAMSDFESKSSLESPSGYSFGSVRKTQGQAYLDNGGFVIEIHRPGCEPTGNDFDLYDERLVDFRFENDAKDLLQLEELVVGFFSEKLGLAYNQSITLTKAAA